MDINEKRNFTWNLSEGNTGIWTTLRQENHLRFYQSNTNLHPCIIVQMLILDDISPFCSEEEFKEINDKILKNSDEGFNWKEIREINRDIYNLMHKYKIYHSVEIKDDTPAVGKR